MRAERNFIADLDLSRPSLRALSYLLRRPEMWPTGFAWYFGSCDTCAMGLAASLWGWAHPNTWGAAQRLDILHSDAIDIFGDVSMGAIGYGPVTHSEITPEMVADRIDQYLAGAR